ncbi:SDR family oxidoreductase [Microvirga tunisiensis]|uniref:dTDP-4-dehydrorhamnose reductase n=1 Tax=Microvirga tunisiensis TaxID=2108360 RepID=A0A5N7MIJ2_9HYPH|nr:sugar nucleotide-binding protein [Microvirga tunisiensis]MPR08697.1 sugar nucleotide-binding protein [Microvirga tunisiensis]MPR26902.1 sugar nucleotide-binding protein [Microvirga tunisiensis]
MILVFGCGGQLGQELSETARSAGTPVIGLSRGETDIADEASVHRALSSLRPDVVMNAGASTKVDQAETDEEAAIRANATGPEILAKACAVAGGPLIHVSTDDVFDGAKAGTYREDDPLAPQKPLGGGFPAVAPIRSKEYPTPAQRPGTSALDSSLFGQTFGCTGRPWESAVDATVARLLA